MDRQEIEKCFRFVNHLHGLFKEPDLSISTAANALVANMEYQIRILARKTKYRDPRTMDYDQWYHLIRSAGQLRRLGTTWETPITTFTALRPIDFRRSSLDVISLVLRGASIELGRRSKILTIPVSRIVLVDRNRDEWTFEGLTIKFILDNGKFEVMVMGPDFEDQGYCHPHIDANGVICRGEASNGGAETMITNALTSCDVMAAYDVVESLLRNYNPRSPYFHLEEINGETCDSCGEVSSELCSCDICGERICSSCHGYCECGNSQDSGCVCSGCLRNCGVCSETICRECLNACEVCGNDICDDCTTACAYCGKCICSDCANTCATCGDNICNGCIDLCSGCGQQVCPYCVTGCEICGGVYCPSCEEANHDECESAEDTETAETG